MGPATNYTEIQHDEIEALRSIYMDEFHEEKAKAGAWNVGFSMFSSLNLLFPPGCHFFQAKSVHDMFNIRRINCLFDLLQRH